jgi:hypothetical protein
MGKHGIAEKLHLQLKWLLMRLEHTQNFAVGCWRGMLWVSNLRKYMVDVFVKVHNI